MSKVCSKCSALLEDDARFCAVCGFELSKALEEEQKEMQQLEESEELKELHCEEETVGEAENAVEKHKASFDDEEKADAVNEPLPTRKEVKSRMKEQLKLIKQNEKQAKLADKARRKAQREQNSERENDACRTKKAGAAGIFASIVLSILLIFNTALLIGLVTCYGVSLVELDNFALVVGDEKLTLNDLSELAKTLESKELNAFLTAISDSERELDVQINGQNLTFEPADDVLGAINELLEFDGEDVAEIEKILGTYMDWVSIALIAVIAYVFVAQILIVVLIAASLAYSRRSMILPGMIFAIIGTAVLAVSTLCVFTGNMFSVTYLEALFAFNSVAICAVVASAAVAVIGYVLTAVGASERR